MGYNELLEQGIDPNDSDVPRTRDDILRDLNEALDDLKLIERDIRDLATELWDYDHPEPAPELATPHDAEVTHCGRCNGTNVLADRVPGWIDCNDCGYTTRLAAR